MNQEKQKVGCRENSLEEGNSKCKGPEAGRTWLRRGIERRE